MLIPTTQVLITSTSNLELTDAHVTLSSLVSSLGEVWEVATPWLLSENNHGVLLDY